MKKLLCLLLALVLTASLLTACAEPNPDTQTTSTVPATLSTTAPTQPQLTTTPTQPTTVPTQPVDTGTEVEAKTHFMMMSDSSARNEKWPIIIRSVAELQKFANTDIGKTVYPISEAVDRYDDAFFAEYSLILVGMYHEWCDRNGFSVESCTKKDGYYLLNLSPSGACVGPYIKMYRILFIEVKDDIPKNAIIYFALSGDYEGSELLH